MTNCTEAAAILRQFNDWRRAPSDGWLEHPTSKEIDEARMRQQEPIGWFARVDGDGPLMECKHDDIPRVPLYALPGAQPAPTMTRDEIIESALKCGVWVPLASGPEREQTIDRLRRFAVLVASAERDACAKVCENLVTPKRPIRNDPGRAWLAGTLDCAGAIRARGDT